MNGRRQLGFQLALALTLLMAGGVLGSAMAQERPAPAIPAPSGDAPQAARAEPGRFDNLGLIALGSIVISGLTIAIGSIAPALGEGRAVAQALSAIAQQPDSSNTITRTLFVGLAMVESTAIYCFVVSMILLFANPFWNYVTR